MSKPTVKSTFDYFGIKAEDVCEVLEVVEQGSFASSYYKVLPPNPNDTRIHYLLFAEAKPWDGVWPL